MPIPGVGFQEVVIILIAALMIFGPAKLPELMGQAGKALRDFRKMTGNLQGEFEKNLNEAAGTDVRKTLSSEIAGLRNEVQGAANTINGKPTPKTTTARPATTKPVTPAASKATTTAAAKKTTTTAAKASTTASTGANATSVSAGSPEAVGSGEIEFIPVRTTSRRGATTAARSAGAPTTSTRPATPAPSTVLSTTTRPRPSTSNGASGAESDATDPFARSRSRRPSAGIQQ